MTSRRWREEHKEELHRISKELWQELNAKRSIEILTRDRSGTSNLMERPSVSILPHLYMVEYPNNYLLTAFLCAFEAVARKITYLLGSSCSTLRKICNILNNFFAAAWFTQSVLFNSLK